MGEKKLYLLAISMIALYLSTNAMALSTEPPGPCGQTHYLLEDDDVIITSPNYPSNYENDLDCQWIIEKSEKILNFSVSVTFTDFHTEKHWDTMSAGHGLDPNDAATTVIKDHSGNDVTGLDFVSTSEGVWISFNSGSVGNEKGFMAEITIASSATTALPTTEIPTTEIPTTEIPTTESTTIEISTRNHNTAKPTIDSVTTVIPFTNRESRATLIPTTTKSTTGDPNTPDDPTTTVNQPTKFFTTRSPATKFSTTRSPTTKFSTTKILTTRFFTTRSPATKFLTTQSPTTKFSTTKFLTTGFFTTRIPATKFSTTRSPTTKFSPTKILTTVMPTEPTGPCGKSYYFLEDDDIIITSPNYTSDYGNDLNCKWIVEKSEKWLNISITVTFTDFDTERHWDPMSAGHGLDPSDAATTVIKDHSGDNVTGLDFVSTSEGVWITFMSDSGTTKKGFRVEITLTGETTAAPTTEIPTTATVYTTTNTPKGIVTKESPTTVMPSTDNDKPTSRPPATNIPTTALKPTNRIPTTKLTTSKIPTGPCGQSYYFLEENDVIITSPNFPNPYPPSIECQWIVEKRGESKNISVTFTDFETEKFWDTMSAGHGIDPSDAATIVIKDHSGDDVTGLNFVSTSEGVWISFISDSGSNTEKGFRVEITPFNETTAVPTTKIQTTENPTSVIKTSIAQTTTITSTKITTETDGSCGQSYYYLEDNDLIITSPKYPSNYQNNADCQWIIEKRGTENILVTVTDFNTEKHWDVLNAGQGLDPSIDSTVVFHEESGSGIQGFEFLSTSPGIWITFKSDASITERGFSIEIALTNQTTRSMNYTLEVKGNLKTPHWPERNYLPNTEIQWLLQATSGLHVLLEFIDFNLQKDSISTDPLKSCPHNYDTVKVYDGTSTSSPIVGVFCGSEIPAVIESSSRHMLVVFQSDGYMEGSGFSANFNSSGDRTLTTTMSSPTYNCGEHVLLNATGTVILTTPNYPQNYNNSLKCLWQIEVPHGKRIDVEFLDFSSEQGRDILQAGNGLDPLNNPSILTHSGNSLPSPVTYVSEGNTWWMTFTSDFSVSYRGFSCQLRTFVPNNCGNSIHLDGETNAVLTSPYFPSRYSNNLDCEWNITTTNGLNIFLNFNEFRTEDTHDILRAGNGLDPADQSTLVVQHSGSTLPRGFISEGNAAWLTFVTDKNIRDFGFEIFLSSFQAQCVEGEFECGNKECVPMTDVCNRIDDCGNNFDEAGCTYPTTIKNPKTTEKPGDLGDTAAQSSAEMWSWAVLGIAVAAVILCVGLVGYIVKRHTTKSVETNMETYYNDNVIYYAADSEPENTNL